MVRPRMDVEFTSKLENDLATVFEKIKLCREMLLESPGIEEDDALAEVIGFLEACRDRMADVIEAGTQGTYTTYTPYHTPHQQTPSQISPTFTLSIQLPCRSIKRGVVSTVFSSQRCNIPHLGC